MMCPLLIVDRSASVIGSLFKMFSLISMCSRLFPSVSSVRFRVSDFMFRSLIHLNFRFVQGDRYGSIQLDEQHVLYMLSLFYCIFCLLHQNQCLWVWGFTSVSSVLFHWTSCLFLCQYYTILLQLLCSTACNKDGDTSVSFIVQDCFNHTIFSLYEIEYYSFKVRKEFCWNVDEDCSDSVDCVL